MALAVRHPRDAFNLGEGDSHRAITVRNFQRNPASISTGLRSLARTHFFLVNLIAQGDGGRASVVEKRINKNDKYNETKTSPYCVDAAATRRLSDRARCDHHKHRSQTGSRPNPGDRVIGREVTVTKTPPAVQVETPTTSPGQRYVWTRGYWRWTGADYEWVPGSWVERPRAAAVWVDGQWQSHRGGWVWVAGHWQ